METNVTFNQCQFEKLNVPQFSSSSVSYDIKIPNLELGKTYYKLTEKNLQAFRIIAIAVKTYGGKSYLIQEPNQPLQWIDSYLNNRDIIFDNHLDIIDYINGRNELNKNNYEEWVSLKKQIPTSLIYREGQFFHTWYIDKYYNPHVKPTRVKYLLILKDSIEICLEQENECFNTEEECIANQLNGFVVNDFEQEVQNITINILPNKSVKKTLHVIEVQS